MPSPLKSKSSALKKNRKGPGRQRTVERPSKRKPLASRWDEIAYLRDKLLYWLYERVALSQARPYAKRLARLLPQADPGHEAILGEECWSLVYETGQDLDQAIQHRENEIRLIRRLWRLSRGKPWADAALEDYRPDDLGDRLDLLAILYHDDDRLDQAIKILQESKRLAGRHGFPFDGADLLQDYMEEKNRRPA
jgi:hypothetical protein